MDQSAAGEISEQMGSTPYLLDPWAVPMRRPRFAWLSEKLESVFPDIQIENKSYWREVFAQADYPATSSWIEDGHIWEGEQFGAIFPTCLKAIPRQRPPPRPAGIKKCDEACLARWKNDSYSYRYLPYQYDWRYLITTQSSWRLLGATEKELLLGYGYNHTVLAWPASKVKQNPRGFDDARHSYLGDSFSIYSFCIVAAALAYKFLPSMT